MCIAHPVRVHRPKISTTGAKNSKSVLSALPTFRISEIGLGCIPVWIFQRVELRLFARNSNLRCWQVYKQVKARYNQVDGDAGFNQIRWWQKLEPGDKK